MRRRVGELIRTSSESSLPRVRSLYAQRTADSGLRTPYLELLLFFARGCGHDTLRGLQRHSRPGWEAHQEPINGRQKLHLLGTGKTLRGDGTQPYGLCVRGKKRKGVRLEKGSKREVLGL